MADHEDNIFSLIFSHMSIHDVLTAEKSNSTLGLIATKALEQKKSVDINLMLQQNYDYEEILSFLYKYGRNIRELKYSKQVYGLRYRILEILPYVPRLSAIDLRGIPLTFRSIKYYATTLFRDVDSASFSVSSRSISRLKHSLYDDMKYLTFFSLTGHYCKEICACIQNLPPSINDIRFESCCYQSNGPLIEPLHTLQFSLPFIETIRLNNCDLPKNIIQVILKDFQNLYEFEHNFVMDNDDAEVFNAWGKKKLGCLTLLYNPFVNNDTLRFIFATCPDLVKLTLGNPPFIQDMYASSEILFIPSDIKTTSDGLYVLNCFQHLTELNLYGFKEEQLLSISGMFISNTLRKLTLVSEDEQFMHILATSFVVENIFLTHLTVLGCLFSVDVFILLMEMMKSRRDTLYLEIEKESFDEKFIRKNAHRFLRIKMTTAEIHCNRLRESILG